MSFFKKWKQGILESSNIQQQEATMWGNLGSTIGLFLGIPMTAYYNPTQWWMCIALIFFCLIQGAAWIGSRQKYLQMKMIDEEIRLQEEIDKMEAIQNG